MAHLNPIYPFFSLSRLSLFSDTSWLVSVFPFPQSLKGRNVVDLIEARRSTGDLPSFYYGVNKGGREHREENIEGEVDEGAEEDAE